MREYLSQSLQKTRSVFKSKPRYPPAWPLHDEQHGKPAISAQEQCPLFQKLSAELRILIYEAALTDRGRLLHMCANQRYGRLRKGKHAVRSVAHVWCVDQGSPFPTWQHTCYGESREITEHQSVFCPRPITTTDDKLLSLLKTCRLVYVSVSSCGQCPPCLQWTS